MRRSPPVFTWELTGNHSNNIRANLSSKFESAVLRLSSFILLSDIMLTTIKLVACNYYSASVYKAGKGKRREREVRRGSQNFEPPLKVPAYGHLPPN